jgi:hypothetical protein
MIGTGIGLFFGGLALLVCVIIYAVKNVEKLGRNMAQAMFDQAERPADRSAAGGARMMPAPGFGLKAALISNIPLLLLYVLSGAMALSGFIIFIVGVVKH